MLEVNSLSKNNIFGNNLYKADFLDHLQKCHIVTLYEIWGHEVDDLPGFQIIATNKPKKFIGKKSGCWSGGILVAVKNFLAPHISVIKKTPDYISCRIDKALFHMEKDLMLCYCYIPPKDSLYFDAGTFSNLENDVNNFRKIFSIILAGDFNARTGVERNFVVDENSKFLPVDDLPIPDDVSRRRNFDRLVNDHGKFYSKCVNHWISGFSTEDVKVTPSVK